MTPVRIRIAIAIAVAASVAAACSGTQKTTLSTVGDGFSPAGGAASPSGVRACPTSAPEPMAAGTSAPVTVETEKGTFVIAVEADLGPRAAGNFVALAGCGFYDGVVFHRVIPGYIIQGGDRSGTGGGGPGYTFPNDPVAVAYDRGVVAMANRGRDTNGSQFFIMLAGTDRLPPDYSVFGHVTDGMDVVDAIAAAADAENPTDPVAMTRLTVGQP